MSDGLKLLSSILAAGSSRAFSDLDRELFVDDELPAFDFIRNHIRVYRQLPAAQTIQEEVGRRMPTANESMEFYTDQVAARYEYAQIRERLIPLRDAMNVRNMPEVEANIQAMNRIVRRTSSRRNSGVVISLADAMQQSHQRLITNMGGGLTGIPSGWPRLDAITGGYQDSDIISWVARMGVGKTYLLLKQAKAAYAHGSNVLFVTTELGAEQIARRYIALELGVNPNHLKNATVSTYLLRRIEALSQSMVGMDRFHLLSVGLESKVDTLHAIIQEFGPDIVFLDGMYLLKPTDISRNASRGDKITAVMDELKSINLSARIPIVLTTQFSRQAGKGGKMGDLESIGYSDSIGTHSSIVGAIKFGPTEKPEDSRILEILKGREGESGKIAINFKFAPLNLDEFTPEQQETEGEATEANVDWMA